MMHKRGTTQALRIGQAFFTSVLLVALLHTLVHFSLYGGALFGRKAAAISGLSIGKFSLGAVIASKYAALSPISKVVLIIEWAIVLLTLLLLKAKQHITLQEEIRTLNLSGRYKKSATKTDLDVLYEILKEKKHLTFSAIATVFKVPKETVGEWCAVLESGNLVTVEYPRIGEPEVIFRGET